MFYFLTSRFITFGNDSFRNIFIIGTICYIIVHAYLFGPNASETTEKYRHYIYYLLLADAILTATYLFFFNKNHKNNKEDEETPLSQQQLEQITKLNNGQKNQSIEDVHRKLLELKAQQTKNNEKKSPFAKKDDNKSNKENVSDTDIPLYVSSNNEETEVPVYK